MTKRFWAGLIVGILFALIAVEVYRFVPRSGGAAVVVSSPTPQDSMAQPLADINAENAELERQLKALQPGSPCNVLNGDLLAACSRLSGRQAQRKFVARNLARPKS